MITLSAIISGLPDNQAIEIDRKNLISLQCSLFDRSDFKLPSFGIISNTGSLRFVDGTRSIKRLAEQQKLRSGMQIILYLHDTISGAESSFGEFITGDWDYNNDNFNVSVNLKDELIELQDIVVPKRDYDHTQEHDLTFEWLYNYLYNLTPQKYNFLTFEQLDSDTQYVLSNIKFEYPYWESKSLWAFWNDLCYCCFCHIYKNNQGYTVLRYNGGN